jgi:hypothetical protein
LCLYNLHLTLFVRKICFKCLKAFYCIFCCFRDAVEEVCRVDLKNDEKYTFQLTFAQDAVDDGLSALQFSCPNTEVMNKWISALSLALSISVSLSSLIDHWV